ncbi:hypothetical protein T07_9927 [Trichinella nelsoni]|uniref:Uncharacterized protein n=1 Tax=Trichinella nelsoni TaxID=6336 RepID=A0A0V0RTG0_9BILA|nr:hypothetical protein T07_9927 [Trichinella nelsoni]
MTEYGGVQFENQDDVSNFWMLLEHSSLIFSRESHKCSLVTWLSPCTGLPSRSQLQYNENSGLISKCADVSSSWSSDLSLTMVNWRSLFLALTSYNNMRSSSGFARQQPKNLRYATLTELTKRSITPRRQLRSHLPFNSLQCHSILQHLLLVAVKQRLKKSTGQMESAEVVRWH